MTIKQQQPWLRTSQRTSASRVAEDLHIPTSPPVDPSQLVEVVTGEGVATTIKGPTTEVVEVAITTILTRARDQVLKEHVPN